MGEKHYKYTSISLIVIIIWILYGLFDHLLEKPGWFHGFGLLVYFWASTLIAVSVGTLLLLIRLIISKVQSRLHIKGSFIYILAGTFNLAIGIIYIVSSAFLNLIKREIDWVLFIWMSSLLIGIIFHIDFYFKKGKAEVVG